MSVYEKEQKAERLASWAERRYQAWLDAERAKGHEPTTLEQIWKIYDIGGSVLRAGSRIR